MQSNSPIPHPKAPIALQLKVIIDPQARVTVLVKKKTLFLKPVCVFAQIGVSGQCFGYNATLVWLKDILERINKLSKFTVIDND